MSQCRVPPTSTGSFGNRLTSCNSTPSAETRAATTRPPEAPRSTPATTALRVTRAPAAPPARPRRSVPALPPACACPVSSEERRCHPGVDRDQQARCQGQVTAGQREDRRGDVLREDLFLQQGPLGVERAQFLLGDAVHGGTLRAPAAGEDPGAAYHPVGVDAVDADADRA